MTPEERAALRRLVGGTLADDWWDVDALPPRIGEQDRAFIAAANPAAVLALLDALDAAERDADESLSMYRRARDRADAAERERDAARVALAETVDALRRCGSMPSEYNAMKRGETVLTKGTGHE